MSTLLRRTLTGALIVLFVLGGFWLHPVTFIVAGLVLLPGLQLEYYRIIGRSGTTPQLSTGIIAGVAIYVISTVVAMGLAGVHLYLLLIPVMSVIMIAELYRKSTRPFDSLAHTLFPVLYTAVPVSILPFAAFHREGMGSIISQDLIQFSPALVIGFFVLLWTNDTMAYLTGITLGRHRLFERHSPKKSWEGFIGGVVFTAVVGFLVAPLFGVMDRMGWVIVSLIVSVAGTYGDLIESMLKRSAGVKDSGSFMPGHGGFLDRFDSVIVSFPLVYVFVVFYA